MIYSFTLTMPTNNSWNGRWSGDEDLHARVRSCRKALPDDRLGYFRYAFGDGWVAAVDVKVVDSREAARLRRKTKGFCGYDWMIDSILELGKILAPHERSNASMEGVANG